MRFNKIFNILYLTSLYAAAHAKLAEIYNECNRPGIVALTLDDGPHEVYTPMVLDLLKEKSVKGTFFINGKNFGKNIEKVKNYKIL